MPNNPTITLDRFPEAIQLILSRIDALELKINQSAPVPSSCKWATTREVCQYFRISEPTLIKLRKEKKIPFLKTRKTIKYNLEDVTKALQENKIR